jgi:hypothetical protein
MRPSNTETPSGRRNHVALFRRKLHRLFCWIARMVIVRSFGRNSSRNCSRAARMTLSTSGSVSDDSSGLGISQRTSAAGLPLPLRTAVSPFVLAEIVWPDRVTLVHMATHASCRISCRPGSPGWWLHLLAGLHFLVWVNFVPLHLTTQLHLDHVIHSHLQGWTLEDAAHGHRHHDGDHVPHLASDHSFDAFRSGTGSVWQFAPALALFVFQADPHIATSPIHPAPVPRPAGRAPPLPLGSRAPPLA